MEMSIFDCLCSFISCVSFLPSHHPSLCFPSAFLPLVPASLRSSVLRDLAHCSIFYLLPPSQTSPAKSVFLVSQIRDSVCPQPHFPLSDYLFNLHHHLPFFYSRAFKTEQLLRYVGTEEDSVDECWGGGYSHGWITEQASHSLTQGSNMSKANKDMQN